MKDVFMRKISTWQIWYSYNETKTSENNLVM